MYVVTSLFIGNYSAEPECDGDVNAYPQYLLNYDIWLFRNVLTRKIAASIYGKLLLGIMNINYMRSIVET